MEIQKCGTGENGKPVARLEQSRTDELCTTTMLAGDKDVHDDRRRAAWKGRWKISDILDFHSGTQYAGWNRRAHSLSSMSFRCFIIGC